MKNYLKLCQRILDEGVWKANRTGTDTIGIISADMEFDMNDGFPVPTTKKFATKACFGELLWFLSGSSDIRDLRRFTELGPDDFCIWQKNLDEYNERTKQSATNTDLGCVYGRVWRAYSALQPDGEPTEIDQINELVDNILMTKKNPAYPSARRLIVNTWDAYAHSDPNGALCALPPCHYNFQCFVHGDELSLKWIQRSADVPLGIPFNIASYALLLRILAKLTGLKPAKLYCSLGDVHIYEDQIDGIKEQLKRIPFDLPELVMPEFETLFDLENFTASDFTLDGYQHHAAIKMNMS